MLMAACKPGTPSQYIQPGDMEDILVDYYMAGSNWKEALETGDRYFKKYPDKFEFGLAYADALCGAG